MGKLIDEKDNERDEEQIKSEKSINERRKVSKLKLEIKREVGDIEDLKISIKERGLFHPILIDNDGNILAGRRRFLAIKELGWTEVDVRVVDPKDELGKLKIEYDENTARKSFRDVERSLLLEKIYKLEQEKCGSAKRGERTDLTSSGPDEVLTQKNFAEKMGRKQASVSESLAIARTVKTKTGEVDEDLFKLKGEALIELSKASDDKIKKEVKKEIKEGKKVTAKDIKKKVRKQQMEEKLKNIDPLPKGKFDVIYADPPWRYDFSETTSREIENKYPTMDVEDIKVLEVPSADNAVLYLWATAPKLREALAVMEAWGFEYKSNMVWDKEIIGMGYWSRGQHEHLLIGTKGKFSPPEEDKRVSSVIKHKREKHSKKPEKVYELIEKMFPNRKYLELFARQTRKGWKSWGAESKDEEPDENVEE